jgi:hypothetical protein
MAHSQSSGDINPQAFSDSRARVLKKALDHYDKEIHQSPIFKAGVAELIVAARVEEADRLLGLINKKSLNPFAKSLDEQLNNFYLALDAGVKMCKALGEYSATTPDLDKVTSDNDEHVEEIKNNFRAAHTQTAQEHIALGRDLLLEKDSAAHIKHMHAISARVNNLTAYVKEPDSPQKFSAVCADVNSLKKMKNTRHFKMIIGGLGRIVAHGMMLLAMALGIGSAASLFFIGPAGLAGLAVSMGLNMGGRALDVASQNLRKQTVIDSKVLATHHSLKLFTEPHAHTEATPFLAKTPVPLTPKHLPEPSALQTTTPQQVNFIDEKKIKSFEPVLSQAGWKLSDVKQVNNENIREVTRNPDGIERKFTIAAATIETKDVELETFKTMLKYAVTADDELPVITTASQELKAKWLVALTEFYPHKTARDFESMVSVAQTENKLDMYISPHR